MKEIEPFVFRTERRLVALTGRRARTAAELLEHLENVSGSSIFYHTHHLYLTQHYVKPRFLNEFADWASRALQEERLAEQLAAVDLLSTVTIRELREALLTPLRRHVENRSGSMRQCPEGNDFHFCESRSFVLPTGVTAHTASEFCQRMSQITNDSIYFHFFEARLRLEKQTNDFSEWLLLRGEKKLAGRIDRVNPYAMSLQQLKSEIAWLGRRYLRG